MSSERIHTSPSRTHPSPATPSRTHPPSTTASHTHQTVSKTWKRRFQFLLPFSSYFHLGFCCWDMLTCGKTRSSFLAGKSKGRQLFFYMRLPATDLDFVGFGVLGFLQWGSIGGFGLEKGSTGSTIANDDNDRSRWKVLRFLSDKGWWLHLQTWCIRICGLIFLLGTGIASLILGWKWWCMVGDGGWNGMFGTREITK